jgi:thioredoxin 1
MSKKLTNESFQKEVLESKGVVVIDFLADWCGPCKALSPVIESLSSEFEDVSIFKLNVDEEPDVAIKLNVRGLPTIVVFKNGIEVDRLIGNTAKEVIQKVITNQLID